MPAHCRRRAEELSWLAMFVARVARRYSSIPSYRLPRRLRSHESARTVPFSETRGLRKVELSLADPRVGWLGSSESAQRRDRREKHSFVFDRNDTRRDHTRAAPTHHTFARHKRTINRLGQDPPVASSPSPRFTFMIRSRIALNTPGDCALVKKSARFSADST